MYFMKPDEFFLLMNYNPMMSVDRGLYVVLSQKDRVRLREAGIRTAIEYPEWNAIEPSQGQYDFTSIDKMLELNRNAGMKTILCIPGSVPPDWMPDDWFARYSISLGGSPMRQLLSFWDVKAQEYQDRYIKMIIAKYSADDVQCIFSSLACGESVLPSEPAFYDVSAKFDFVGRCRTDVTSLDIRSLVTKEWLRQKAVEHFTDKQALFVNQHNEVWNMLQWLIGHWSEASVNYAQPQILGSFRSTYPNAKIVLLQYTYYDPAHPIENDVYVDDLMRTYNCDVIVEAHFCSELAETTPKSIAKGFRGQIICPLHPQNGEKVLQPWMLKAIYEANELWKASRR